MDKTIDLNSREDQKFLLKYAALVIGSFLVFYSLPNFIGTQRSEHYHAYLQWELDNIPLIPEFIFIYVSSYLQIFVPILFLTKAQLVKYAKGLTFVTIIAGIVFYVFPSVQGFPRLEEVPRLSFMFKLLYILDPPHNLFPSLHITYSTMTSMTIRHFLKKDWQKYTLYIWQLALYLSVLFVHQHHLFDILTGLILAGTGIYLFEYHKIYPNDHT